MPRFGGSVGYASIPAPDFAFFIRGSDELPACSLQKSRDGAGRQSRRTGQRIASEPSNLGERATTILVYVISGWQSKSSRRGSSSLNNFPVLRLCWFGGCAGPHGRCKQMSRSACTGLLRPHSLCPWSALNALCVFNNRSKDRPVRVWH